MLKQSKVFSRRNPSSPCLRRNMLITMSMLSGLLSGTAGFVSLARTCPPSAGANNHHSSSGATIRDHSRMQSTSLNLFLKEPEEGWPERLLRTLAVGIASSALVIGMSLPAIAENELSAKYGGGLDTSLVDQKCLLSQCNLQAKACLQDDASCRKGLTCTAKCLGDNACITGCMARYGNEHLDDFLKCTIEDHECIKVAILPGGFDAVPPAPPAPILTNFDPKSMTGSWFKVMGFNPNYDCYAQQRNSFEVSSRQRNSLEVDVEFSMPRLLPDGIVPVALPNNAALPDHMAMNSYKTHELMVFDENNKDPYGRSAHSHGEMFGLQFWENWYFIGENEKGADEEFKFVYYNGKTRQNTYDGAFVYARKEHLSPASMEKVYQIAESAGLNPNQFCQVQNAGIDDNSVRPSEIPADQPDFWRGLLASTRISELLGVEPVAARDTVNSNSVISPQTEPQTQKRAWWYEAGDYLENPHRHFQAMEQLRVPVHWPHIDK